MKDVFKHFKANEVEYPFCFNINVLERLHDEYKTVDEEGEETDGFQNWANKLGKKTTAGALKHLKFMMMHAINEGIAIENDEKHDNRPLITLEQTGRVITGLEDAMLFTKQAITESNNSGKNAQTGQSQATSQ